jgi:large subunit ribosomal protein L6
MVNQINQKLEIPAGISVTAENLNYHFKGNKGQVVLHLKEPTVKIEIEGNHLHLKSTKGTKKEKKIMFTYVAKIKSAFKGVTEGFTYTMKICSGHFPMNVTYANKVFSIKNFLGEKVPRVLKIKYDNVEVKIDGNIVIVQSPDREIAGQTAANIEQLCRRPGFDKRIFQDGVYIINKAGKEI